jgi:RimJ/RimL family protein N-acetyltransferase
MSAPHESQATTMLHDGKQAIVRPLEGEDHGALIAFGQALPQDDLLYLEDDFQRPEIISRLINARFASNWRQCVATVDGQMIGYAAVRQLPGWSRHVGDIILVVSESWRHSGIGTVLASAIFDSARSLGVSKVIIEMMEEQTAGRAIFERLGFHLEGTLRAHARDRFGQDHNLVILAYYM